MIGRRQNEALGLWMIGMSYKEISKVMQVSPNRVKELLSGARARAREVLEEAHLFAISRRN